MHNNAQSLSAAPAELVITAATLMDTLTIHELAMRIWPECFSDIIAPEKLSNMVDKIYKPESIAQQMKDGQQFWLASLGRQPVGYFSAMKTDATIWIKKLYLDGTCRSAGLGTRMLNHAIAAFQPADEVKLYVHRDNFRAQGFYTREKFVFCGEEEVTMGDYQFTDKIFRKELR